MVLKCHPFACNADFNKKKHFNSSAACVYLKQKYNTYSNSMATEVYFSSLYALHTYHFYKYIN